MKIFVTWTYRFKVTFDDDSTSDINLNVSQSSTMKEDWEIADLWIVAARKANNYNLKVKKIEFIEKI